jgi:hypothetical protein
MRRLQPPRAAAWLPCPLRTRPRGARRAAAWPAWSLSGHARPPRPAPTRRPGSATDLPLTSATSAGSPASRPPGPSIEPSTARPPPGPPPVPVVTVARPLDPVPPPPPEHGRRPTRPDRRGKHQTAGQRTAGHQTAGHRTAGQPDPGHRHRMGGHRGPTPWLLAGSATATTPGRSIPAGRCCGQPSSGRATTRTTQQQGRRGHQRCHGWVWPPPRPSAAGGTPLSSWRLGALLSSDDLRVERRANGDTSSVMARCCGRVGIVAGWVLLLGRDACRVGGR